MNSKKCLMGRVLSFPSLIQGRNMDSNDPPLSHPINLPLEHLWTNQEYTRRKRTHLRLLPIPPILPKLSPCSITHFKSNPTINEVPHLPDGFPSFNLVPIQLNIFSVLMKHRITSNVCSDLL